MSRIERLVNLTAALLSASRPLSAEEIRDLVPGYPPDRSAFRRQFERDKEALRELGVPLQTIGTEMESAAYVVPKEEYYLKDPGLAPDELHALHLASQLVRVEGVAPASGLWKLAADGAPSADAPGTVDALGTVEALGTVAGRTGDGAAPIVASLPASELLAVAFTAITDSRRMSFRYRGEQRSVLPRRLTFRTGHWYLVGFDTARRDDRSFRLDRLETGIALGSPFDPSVELPRQNEPAAVDAYGRPWSLGAGEPVRALVVIDAEQAPWALTHLGEDAVAERRDDGSVVMAFDVVNTDAFRSFVLGFLDHAVVLSPPELRLDIVQWLEAIRDMAAAPKGT